MNLWDIICGMVQLQLTSASGTEALQQAANSGIDLFDMENRGDLTISCWIRRKDLPKMRKLCQKRGDALTILRHRGGYWLLKQIPRRPVLVIGLGLILLLSIFLQSRILFVQVEGNGQIPTRAILEAAETCGVKLGASRRSVRSEKVKNALMEAVPELQWAGVNTAGCVAVISVQERKPGPSLEENQPLSSIVAQRDGYILSADVTRGTALVQVGQTVKEGQTLVSGYTDCGLCIRVTGAEGEIFARTRREFSAVTPSQYTQMGSSGRVRRKISLQFQKNRIILWKDSGISGSTCGRMDKEYFITLPGGFQLPLGLRIETYFPRDARPGQISRKEAESQLKTLADAALRQQMISGEIVHRQEQVTMKAGVYALEGLYQCTEMIGRKHQIGDTNG